MDIIKHFEERARRDKVYWWNGFWTGFVIGMLFIFLFIIGLTKL